MNNEYDDLEEYNEYKQGIKNRRSRNRKLSMLKERDSGEHKGAYGMKIIHPKKQEYKRIKKVEYYDNPEGD